jgi:DNA-binding HxlR family transcriptional regulator
MRKGYGQFCPVAKAAEVLAERWTPLVMRELLEGSKHFNDLHRGVPLMSRSLLSLRLKQLEAVGAVERRSGQRGWEYHLTSAGNEISPIIQSLGEWGQRWYRSNFGPEDLDVGRLMWALRLTVRPEHFPPRRITVQFDYTDVPANKRRWWVVSDQSDIDICPLNPGFEPDLYVATDLQTITRILMGDLSYKAAIAAGAIELDGKAELRRNFDMWLGRSHFAHIEDARQPTRIKQKISAAR